MSEWKVVTIDQVANIKSGKRLPKGHTLVQENTILPYVRLVDVTDGKIMKDNLMFLEANTQKLISRYIVKKGDVCLAIVGHTIGMVFQVDDFFDGANLTENAARITDFDDQILSQFLYYYLISKIGQQEIISRKVGSAQGKLPLYNIRSLPINLPPLPEQKSIAHILGTLDDKIVLNRQMNQTLEAMAQALFKSWFVDFDPVMDNVLESGNPIPDELQGMAEKRRVIANREARSGKQSHRLLDTNPELAAQFPSSFVFNETLGKWIPEGWEVKKLENISACNKNSWTAKNAPEQVEYVDLSNTKNGDILETTIYSYEEAPSRAKRILKIGDTIFGTVRPGNRSFAYIGKEGLTGSTGFAVLSPLKKEYRAFTYLYTTQEEMIELYAHLADGAAYPAINSSVIAESLIVYSGDEILSKFEKLAGSNISKMVSNKRGLETLTQLRDRLLPELISGKIRVNIKGNTK
ncbi:restriction endonuclease subunit S [Algoriphagus sp.]|uniref:restriction endonuclease subunit S n=1 Tax=Algoriphagus sp. TaxID=1872435 RepID=UPI003F7189C0